ncbi:ricin-type beta-trefoil lectin domain protein [Streptomyces sp. NPDC058464]|uniref:ricin-type beta-trefoil lectin domain protein n=1 Tax=Streptomyces sp. NPDC058464 TaxID=3346511 RepID=UPI003665FEE2
MADRSSLLTTALRGSPVIALLALLLSPLATAPAAAATGTVAGLAGKCLDVAGAGTADGTPVQLYDCNGTGAQQWTPGADNTLRALGKCLDVTANSTADGAKVQLWTCTGAANQQWTVTAAHDIVNPAADKCLDVTDRSSANGARIQIWTCTGAANQKWNAPSQQSGEQCWATHYGPQPPGALTASGEVFDNNADTVATSLSRQPQLPFGTRVLVTNVANGRSLTVRVNDRGTFVQTPQEPKCLDLTDGAFSRLGGVLDPDAGHIVVTQQVVG